MLVLTRKLMEKLYIGDNVCVTVVRLEGGQVRLGIEAPREVPVVRAELLDGREISREHLSGPMPAPGIAPVPPAPLVGFKIRPGVARGTGIPHRGPSR